MHIRHKIRIGIFWLPLSSLDLVICHPYFITWLRNVRLDSTNSHFSRFNLRFIFINLVNTYWRCSKCSSQLMLWTFKSFINTFNNLSMCVLKTSIIVIKNMLITFHIPKDMTISNNFNSVIKANLHISSRVILIYQNPYCKYSAKNHYDFPSWVKTFSTKAIGNEYQCVCIFNGL